MKLWDYLRDRGMLLLLHLVCMCAAAFFFRLTGYSGTNTALILAAWLLVLTAWLTVHYLGRRKFFREAGNILEKIDQRYLLGELLPDSDRLEDRLYREMIRSSNKSCIERIRRVEDEKKDYKEYIESWVHEIKAPITGIALFCDNREPDYRRISLENRKIENCVDMVLYYARSEEVYKDYLICETELEEVVCEVLEKNRLLLIESGFQAQVDCSHRVYTDRKWIAFILEQMIWNSVKYRGENPLLRIRTKRLEKSVVLSFADNGIGIAGDELPRIFEKGFTGSNGRSRERSTGMGLYLSRRLCKRLGIGIRAESEAAGTTLFLEFPIGDYHCGIQGTGSGEKDGR
ncbi:MAG: sensor histidine kinase [Roseburia sp.]|nr:sensor histidine kinase [Roseburia sp.]MCM1098285.1 sensor histidine kinase [Ruminococcus flavefaciens]